MTETTFTPIPTPEEARKSRLIADYTNGTTLKDLATSEGEPARVIRADLVSWGIRIRGRGEARQMAMHLAKGNVQPSR
ncbi:hypothetical protein [Kitasatospora kifunensis]|uniref:Uncharacterized protein n=1 Tax=Kitasatospora kifunensis TaxID=58351 RepID=A0A7W7RBG6_KITKI|nr:hypothetical protein [Kitasatospora kifunensis]MBB4928301.1 hypothetical protein [Kitasatospora kifunensis]